MDKRTCAIVTNGNHTDIVLITYSNRTLLIVTQFKKFGTFLTINREPSMRNSPLDIHDVYMTKAHFGTDSDEVYIAANYIADHIDINRSFLLSIALKDYSMVTLKDIANAIKQVKPW